MTERIKFFIVVAILICLNRNIACEFNGTDLIIKNNNCANINLEALGCSVILLHSSDLDIKPDSKANFFDSISFTCPFAAREINCKFKNDQNELENEFQNLIDTLAELDKCCWSILSFENVYEIIFQAFFSVKLGRFNDNNNKLNGIFLNFKNVYKVDSMAFEMQMASTEDIDFLLDNLYINLNGIASFDYEKPKTLELKDDSFSNLYCKELKFTNFLPTSYLSLSSKMFANSFIQQLYITESNFTGFTIDSDDDVEEELGFFETLIIEDCFLNGRLNKYVLGKFTGCYNLYIINSAIEIIESNTFDNYEPTEENGIKQLFMNDNLITKLAAFKHLSKLEFLSLDNNPLVEIDKGAFEIFRFSLQKLSLKFSKLDNFINFYPEMPEMKELILSNNDYANIYDLRHVFVNSPKLMFLDLSNMKMIATNGVLNIFELIDSLIGKSSVNLKYIDIRTQNDNDSFIDENEFFARFSKYIANTYLESLLSNTFIRMNSNHPCNCAIFYLYKNFLRYEVPIENLNIESLLENSDNYIHTYKKIDWAEALFLLPKCYRNIPFADWYNMFSLKCNKTIFTTTTKSTTEILSTITPTTEVITTTTTTITITTTLTSLTVNTTKNEGDENENTEIKSKFIGLEIALPFMIALFSLMILALIIFTLKYRIDYKQKFIKSCNNTANSIQNQSKIENRISTLSLENNNIDSEKIESFWGSFNFHTNKKSWRLRFKRIF